MTTKTEEPTREEKEACFKLWLESYWNEGPFTDISGEEIFKFPSGYSCLDFPGLSEAKTEKVATSYGYGDGSGFFGLWRTACQNAEMMMLDFILLDLADELGYDLIELQNEEHWQLYLANKEQIEKEGWIPYDGKGMPEGLTNRQAKIWCRNEKVKNTKAAPSFQSKMWWWGAWGAYASSIAFYLPMPETAETEAEKPVGNPENENV